jgi:hypothetical protein
MRELLGCCGLYGSLLGWMPLLGLAGLFAEYGVPEGVAPLLGGRLIGVLVGIGVAWVCGLALVILIRSSQSDESWPVELTIGDRGLRIGAEGADDGVVVGLAPGILDGAVRTWARHDPDVELELGVRDDAVAGWIPAGLLAAPGRIVLVDVARAPALLAELAKPPTVDDEDDTSRLLDDGGLAFTPRAGPGRYRIEVALQDDGVAAALRIVHLRPAVRRAAWTDS